MVASGPDVGGACWYCQTVRARRARSEGVTRVNQWSKLRKCEAGSNLADLGRSAARDSSLCGGSTSKPSSSIGEKATVKCCGVTVARLPG